VPHTLLLADDSVTIQRVIELTFADEDIQVVAVSDGDKAIEHLNANPTDIVLADIGMPGKSGYEVAQYIRQSPRLKHIPVVLLTGAFEPVDQERADQAGCDGVLAKPFEPQLVIGRVKELLARSSRKDDASGPAPAAPPEAADIAWPAPQSVAPGADVPLAAPSSSTSDYFDKLDAAFATLTNSARPVPSSDLPHVSPPTPANLDWFASQLNAPAAAPIAREWDLPKPAATSEADDLVLMTPEETVVEDLILGESGAEVLGVDVSDAGAEVLGAAVRGAVPGAEVPSAPHGDAAPAEQHSAPDAAPEHDALQHSAPHQAPSTPALQHPFAEHSAPPAAPEHDAPQHSAPPAAPEHDAPQHSAPHPAPSTAAPQHPDVQHPIALPSLSDAFATLLAAEQDEPRPTVTPVWPVAGTAIPAPEPPPAPVPPPLDMDDVVDRVTRRVLDRLADSMLREAVADLTSAVAERLVREEIERIKSSIK
jgi:CheY-like chemotaxis protein